MMLVAAESGIHYQELSLGSQRHVCQESSLRIC